MRLIACHVENFGKLSSVNINFNEGINIINKPNGWGKSTMAAFFKAMLYGFDTKKEPGVFEKERKIYRPWQGGVYGGEIDFEIDGKRYRISRTFGTTEKTDEFHLYDLSTNLECDDYSENIGEEIFDLDRASFKRSIFIAQNDIVSESSDAINAKLGNLVENTNDINNFETAQNLIKDMMNKLSPNRITGSIKKRKNTIAALNAEIKGYEAAEDSVNELNKKLDEKRLQKNELADIRNDYGKALQIASEDSRRKELKKNYEALCEEEKEKGNTYYGYRNSFPNEVPTEEELSILLDKARKLEEQNVIAKNLAFSEAESENYNKLKELFSGKLPSDEILDEMQQKASNITKVKGEHSQLEMKLSQMESVAMLTDREEDAELQPKKSSLFAIGVVTIIIGLLACVAAVTLSIYLKNDALTIILLVLGGVAVVAAVAGIIFMILGIQKNRKITREIIRKIEEREQQKKAKEAPIIEMKEQLVTIENGIEDLDSEVKGFLQEYGIACDYSEYQTKLFELKTKMYEYIRMGEKNGRYVIALEKCEEIKKGLDEFAQNSGIAFSEEIVADLNKLQAKAAECRLAEKNYLTAKEKKEAFEKDNDIEKVLSPSECPYSLEELNKLIKDVDDRAEDVRGALEQYNRQLEAMQEQLDYRDEKEQELRNCLELQDEETKKFEVLSCTSEYLQKAKEQFTARYMEPISKGFQKYFEILTGDTSRNWMIDTNISFKMRVLGELRDVKWLSAGYKDLIGVCMRFALVDAMFPDEKPFLILDDPFVNLDDEKIERGKELLIALEKDYQAIYFTCHESREYN